MPSIRRDRERPLRARRAEEGQAAVEFGGLLTLIAMIVSALVAIGLPGRISSAIGRSVDAALSGQDRPSSVGHAPAANGPGTVAGAAGSAGSANRGSQASRLPSGGQRPYVPPKGAHGRPQPVRGGGFKDAYGNVWKWDPSGHAGPHWDVQHPDRSHTNVDPDGNVIGEDNFPNKAPTGSGDGGDSAGSTAKKAAGGAAIVGGAGVVIWWGAKILSPACGPLAPVCAIFG